MLFESSHRLAVIQVRIPASAPVLGSGDTWKHQDNCDNGCKSIQHTHNHSFTRIHTSEGQKSSVFTFFSEARTSFRLEDGDIPTALKPFLKFIRTGEYPLMETSFRRDSALDRLRNDPTTI